MCSTAVYSSPRNPEGFCPSIIMDEYIFGASTPQPNECEMSKPKLYMLKTPPIAPYRNVALSNTRMHLFMMLYSLSEIVSGLCPHLWNGLSNRGLMGVMRLSYCVLLRPLPQHDSTFPAWRWRGMAILSATMATSLQSRKGFGGPQWVLF